MSSYSNEVLNSSILPSWTSENLGGQAFVLSRKVTNWRSSLMSWTEGFSFAKDGSTVANAATYKIGGLAAGVYANVDVNGNVTKVRVGQDGTLEFSAPLVAGENNISVSINSGFIILCR